MCLGPVDPQQRRPQGGTDLTVSKDPGDLEDYPGLSFTEEKVCFEMRIKR
jgi:hypothetical protein